MRKEAVLIKQLKRCQEVIQESRKKSWVLVIPSKQKGWTAAWAVEEETGQAVGLTEDRVVISERAPECLAQLARLLHPGLISEQLHQLPVAVCTGLHPLLVLLRLMKILSRVRAHTTSSPTWISSLIHWLQLQSTGKEGNWESKVTIKFEWGSRKAKQATVLIFNCSVNLEGALYFS